MKLLLWKLSALALSLSSGADSSSSLRPGELEANPLLATHGHFTGRSVAIEGAITGAILGGEWLILRRNPKLERSVSAGNFAASGIHAGAAVRNWRLK
jgi:hypothetical protein